MLTMTTNTYIYIYIYICTNDLVILFTQVAMLQKENNMLVIVHKRLSEEVALLSAHVQQPQVYIFLHGLHVC